MKTNSRFLSIALLSVWLLMPLAAVCQEPPWDPIEPVNRGIFWFNDKADVYVIEPVAKQYKKTLPDYARRGVTNFFNNLKFPARAVSDLLQLKFEQLATQTGRFLVNTTIGVGGLMDVASDLGLKDHADDIGVALARMGVPPGPYLVLPFLGPSNVRDGIGRLGDTALHPLYWVTYSDMDAATVNAISWGGAGLFFLNERANLIEAIKAAKESSIDYYLFVQSAYYQYREGLLKAEGEGTDEEEEPVPSSF